MSSIGKKIRLAFSRKKPEIVETIRFSEVKSYIEKLRKSEKVPSDRASISLLTKKYKEFMEKLDDVKKELEILQKNGEKRFTKITNENLKEIKNLDEFNSSSLREFYVDTAQVIHSIMMIPARIQRKTLNYKNGKETIDALNSFLKSFRNLKKAYSETLTRNSAVEYHGNALKKYKEMEEYLRKKEDLQNRIELLKKEKEEKKRNLEERTANLQTAQSKIDNEEILEAKKRIIALDSNIREISIDLKIYLRKGRRPISKILHSKDRKLFEFYQYFAKYPLENINEKFWKMIATLEKENINLGMKERKKIDDFLNFAKKKLKAMIKEYEDAKAKKKKLEENFRKISSRNENTLRNFKLQREIAQNDFTRISGRLDELERDENMLEIDIKKNARILEKMLSEIGNNKVKIKFD
jgi:DNA repair exonuclease SbcCD ATPase subunit